MTGRTDLGWLAQRSYHENPKEGDTTECTNWRGFTLLSVVSKVFTSIILTRIQQVIHITDFHPREYNIERHGMTSIPALEFHWLWEGFGKRAPYYLMETLKLFWHCTEDHPDDSSFIQRLHSQRSPFTKFNTMVCGRKRGKARMHVVTFTTVFDCPRLGYEGNNKPPSYWFRWKLLTTFACFPAQERI